MICPMFNDKDCRFLSEENLLVPYTKLEQNPKTKRLEPTGNYMDKVALGAYCNNGCAWVKDLKVCPARWGLRGVATVGVAADGSGSYLCPQYLFPQEVV